MSENFCDCGHPAYVHARVDQRDNTFTYPCRQVLPFDPSDGRLRAEPPPCPCVDFRAAPLGGFYNGAMS